MSVVTAAESDILTVVGDRMRVLVDGNECGAAFEMFVVDGDEGSGPPPHAHPWLESYYVIEGKLMVEVEGEQTIAEPGTSAVVKAGQVHRFEVLTPTARFIVATDGKEASNFFRDLSANAPGAPTPENLPQIIEVAKRNGLTSPLF
jgi:quercetin dioxygenase-like cupin family protein